MPQGHAIEDVPEGGLAEPSSRTKACVLTLFLFSGASSLALETIWVRQLRGVLGNNVYAVSTVLAVFMAGLAIGSLLAGRLPTRCHPLRVYARLQWGIGGLGILSVLLLGQTGPACSLLYGHFGFHPLLLDIARYSFCFVVLVLPATLMGATLPVLSRFVVAKRSQLGDNVGLLYGVNTLGAALGCALTGFFLLGNVGIRWTALSAAAINVGVGLFAWRWSGGTRSPASADSGSALDAIQIDGDPERTQTSSVGAQQVLVFIAFGLAGFCGLGYEVLWTRGLVFFLGNTVYAFTTVLTACLIGIAVGSVVAAPVADRVRSHLGVFGVLEALIGCWGLLLLYFIGLESEYLVRLAEHRPVWESTTVGLFKGFLMVLVPTFLMGAVFPVASCACARKGTDVAREIGTLYACNTVGAILGSVATGFLLMPRLGMEGGVTVLAAINLALGALLWGADGSMGRTWRISGAVLIVAVATAGLALRPTDVFRRLHQLGRPNGTIALFREDPAGTVTVIDKEGDRRILVDNIDVAGTSATYTDSSIALAHIPLMLHPDPRNVFILGFGAGGTTSSISTHPAVQHMDAAELCRSVAEAAPMFESVNRNVLEDSRLKLVVADGREFLLTTHNTYEVISIDLLLAASAGSGSLYTREFYVLCQSRLAEDGIAAQWISPAHIPLPMLKTILRTAQSVFPYTALWFSVQHRHLVMLAANRAPQMDLDLIAQRMRVPAVKADLQRVGLIDPCDFLNRFVADGEDLVRFSGKGPLNTDDLPLVEFVLPTSDNTFSRLQNLSALCEVRGQSERVTARPHPAWEERMKEAESNYQSVLDAVVGQEYAEIGRRFSRQGDTRQAMALWQRALALNEGDAGTHYSVGVVLYGEGLTEPAIRAFRRVIELAPNDGEAHNNLGGLLLMTDDLKGAERHLRTAATLLPREPAARTNLASVLVRLGRPAEGISQYETVLRDFPTYRPALAGLAETRKTLQNSTPGEEHWALPSAEHE